MGLAHSYFRNDLSDIENNHFDDPLIRIELSNTTPIVGVEMKPVVHLRRVSGCIFEWRRMPKPKRPILSRPSTSQLLLSNHQHQHTTSNEHVPEQSSSSSSSLEQQQQQQDVITNVGVPTELRTVGSVRSFRILPPPSSPSSSSAPTSPITTTTTTTTTVEDQQQQQSNHRSNHTDQAIVHSSSNTTNTQATATAVVLSEPNFNNNNHSGSSSHNVLLGVGEQKGILSQGVHYTPSQQDVGHPLRFSVTFIGYQHSITSFIETQPTIPLPSRTPARKWLQAPDWNVLFGEKSAKQLQHPLSIPTFAALMYNNSVSSKFTMVSYQIIGRELLHLLRKKQELKGTKDRRQRELCEQVFPHCPSYVFTDVYRRKLLLRELLSYNADLLCLQLVHEQLYNEWSIELSKNGYSGLFKLNEPALAAAATAQQQQQQERQRGSSRSNSVVSEKKADASTEIEYSDDLNLGSCIMYKRGKFNKTKEWIVRLSDTADVVSMLDRLCSLKQITVDEKSNILNQCQSSVHCAMVAELEFRDMFDIMNKFKKTSPTLSYSSAVLLLANATLYGRADADQLLSQKERAILRLLQTQVITNKIQSIIRDEGYAQKNIRVAVVFAGDLDSNMHDLPYDLLSRFESPYSENADLNNTASMSSSGDGEGSSAVDDEGDEDRDAGHIEEENKDKCLLEDDDDSPDEAVRHQSISVIVDKGDVSADTTQKDSNAPRIANLSSESNLASYFDNPLPLLSAYREALSREAQYSMSDANKTLFNSTNFVFYSPNELKITRVSEEPSDRTFPNIYFVSDRVALLCEFDLEALNNPPLQLTARSTAANNDLAMEHPQ